MSAYTRVFHLGGKEAAATVALTPFLMEAVKVLEVKLKHQYFLDSQFVVYQTPVPGRNPSTDMAIVVS